MRQYLGAVDKCFILCIYAQIRKKTAFTSICYYYHTVKLWLYDNFMHYSPKSSRVLQFRMFFQVFFGKVTNEELVPGPNNDVHNNNAIWKYKFKIIFKMKVSACISILMVFRIQTYCICNWNVKKKMWYDCQRQKPPSQNK